MVTSAETPKPYLVETPSGQLQRNRIQLRVVPQESNAGFPEELSEPEKPHQIMTRSQTGAEIRSPLSLLFLLRHIKQLSAFKFFFSVYKIHVSTLEAGFQGSVMERQITFKPFPGGSSRNGQDDIYFHVKRNSLIRPFSWYKVGV